MNSFKSRLTVYRNNNGKLLFIECIIPFLEAKYIIDAFARFERCEKRDARTFDPDSDNPEIEMY